MERQKANTVVVDAVAFFKNVQLQEFAEKVYTVRPVVSEIRDIKTRQRLALLPYQLNFRQPSKESIQKVSDFARKTGDYQSLSAVDIQVMALAHQMTRELVGTTQIKQEPDVKRTFSASTKPLEKNSDIVGFYYPSQSETCPGTGGVPLDLVELSLADEDGASKDGCQSEDSLAEKPNGSTPLPETIEPHSAGETGDREPATDQPGVDGQEECKTDGLLSAETAGDPTSNHGLELRAENEGRTAESPELGGGGGGDEHQSVDEEDTAESPEQSRLGGDEHQSVDEEDTVDVGEDDEDDDVGWITPQNLQNAKNKMSTDIMDSLEGIKVACLTSDFAMQNVLIQMGIPVMSIEGMLIKRAKSYALRCFACFKVTSDTSRAFCPKCGNATLTKVSVSIDEQGNMHYHMSKRRRYRAGELRQSLPLPKGGKHADNPIVCEDQPRPEERMSKKAMIRNNVFDPDYMAQNSPFVSRDVTSRSAILGVARKKQQNKRGRRK